MSDQDSHEELCASRVNRYLGLEGEITPEECDQFEADLLSDPLLREEYLLTVNMLQLANQSKDSDDDEEEDCLPHTETGEQIFQSLKKSLAEKQSFDSNDEVEQVPDYTSLVHRYLGLEGQITPDEIDQFEAELETNEDLKEEYILTVNMLQLANMYNDSNEGNIGESDDLVQTDSSRQIYHQLKSWMAQSQQAASGECNQTPLNPKVKQNNQVDISTNNSTIPAAQVDGPSAVAASVSSRGSRFTYWLSGIAAVLVIGFFIGKSFWGVPEYKFEDWTPPSEGVARGAEHDSIPDLLKRADYKEALDVINPKIIELENAKKEIEANSEMSNKRKYQLNDSLFALERHLWYKGNALIGLKCTNEVDSILHQLKEMNSPYYDPLDSLYHVYK